MKTRILIVDDHQIIREGLRLLIERQEDLCVVGEAENGRQALDQVRQTAPHILLMDVGMPDLNGMEATRRIREQFPAVRVIALTMHADRQYLQEMLTAGAAGYLLKDCASEELVNALRTVRAGHTYLSPRVAGMMVEDWLRKEADTPRTLSGLSGREREVLQLLAEGRATRDIADRLRVSAKTVESHRKNLMEKLRVSSVAELTKIAIREGLTPLES